MTSLTIKEACPACGASSTKALRVVQKHYPLLQCSRCGHAFLTTSHLPKSMIEDAYDDNYDGFRPDEVFAALVRDFIREQIEPRLPPPARVLDVGCGNGEFMQAMRERTYTITGIDLSEAAADRCRARGLSATAGDFLDPALLGEQKFHLITMWDLIEHLPEPYSFARRAHELLEPGGMLFIKTPRINALSVQLTRAVPRLAGGVLGSPSHLQFFRRESLQSVFDRVGFRSAHWCPSMRIRGTGGGGSLRRRAARHVVQGIHRASGDGNLFVFAARD